MDTLSICIPSNRSIKFLGKCLKSIAFSSKPKKLNFDICISDNGQDYSKKKLIDKLKGKLKIKYQFIKKKTNRIENMCNSISQSNSDFIWLLGDDEIISKNSLINLEKIFLAKKKNVDLIFLNSKCRKKNQDIKSIHFIKKFYDLIDYKISDDFMGGMFLSVFRRSKWVKHKKILNKFKKDKSEFSSLGNTFPHLMVFSKAFMKSDVYFSKKIYTYNFIKNREWSNLWALVQSVRTPELLDNYRKEGLPFMKFIVNKNYSLRFFLPHIFKILINNKFYPITLFEIIKSLFKNTIYPFFYLSPIIWALNKSQVSDK